MENSSYLILSLGSALCAFILYLIHKKCSEYLQRKFIEKESVPMPNGDGKNLKLTLVNGCGLAFAGTYRETQLGNQYSYVTYYTFHILAMPILAIRAYRVIPQGEGWIILGSEKSKMSEIGLIFLNAFRWIFTIIAGIMLVIFIVSLF